MSTITIDSLDVLEDVFKRIQSGEIIHIEQLNLGFLESVNFKIFGDMSRYNGMLPASLALGLCEFQTEMYKVYALIKYRTDNLKKLGGTDKYDAEITFSVDPGCTKIITRLTGLFKALGNVFEKVTQEMSPNQKTLCYLFTITLACGGGAGLSYFSYKSEVDLKQEETKLEEAKMKAENERLSALKEGMLQAIRDTSGVDAARRAEDIQSHVARAYTSVLKSVSDADRVEIDGAARLSLSQSQIREILMNPSEKAIKKEGEIEVLIDSIRRTSEKIMLSCHEPSSEYSFPVSVDTSYIDDKDEIALLFDSMKENRTVKILGNYKIRAGIIESGNASTITKP